MGWKVWGDVFEGTGALNAEQVSQYQVVTFPRNVVLRAARTWIIVYGDPAFDPLRMRVWANRVEGAIHSPMISLHTSTDHRTKAEIHSLPYAVKEIYFSFADVTLKAGASYSFSLESVNDFAYGYVANTSYLLWRKAFPDPVYRGGFTPAIERINRAPYELYFIGSNF